MLTAIATCLLALTRVALSLPTIEGKGSKLFLSTGEQFYIKGVAYQLTSDDPLVDTNQCQLDASLMKTLGTNSIRVYHVDPTADHDGCMSAFSDAGIYAWIDLDTFSTYIIAADPKWTQSMYSAYQQVMDTFQKYDNVAGFFVGNEVLTTGPNSIAAPYVKAAARDMKAYRDAKGYRSIPVGYSAADIAVLRPNLQNYLACGDNSSETVDFYGLNAYEWCGQSSYQQSGYAMLEQNATNYSLPIFFSETGCNVPEPRTFDDQSAIFGPDMVNTWSGAIIYEWIEETNNYGLISYGPSVAATATAAGVVDGFTRTGTPTPITPDFPNLSSQWATLSPTGISMSDYTPSNSPPACPPYTSGAWEVNGNVPLPTIGQTFNAAESASFTSGGSSSAPATSVANSTTSASASASSSSGSGSKSSASLEKGMAGTMVGLVAAIAALCVLL